MHLYGQKVIIDYTDTQKTRMSGTVCLKVSPIDGEADSSEGPEEIFIIHKAVSTDEQMDWGIKQPFSVKYVRGILL